MNNSRRQKKKEIYEEIKLLMLKTTTEMLFAFL